jgi:hypothetical protein
VHCHAPGLASITANERVRMKVPTMTKGIEWLWLVMIVLIEAVLAFACFLVGSPLSYFGLVLVVIANLQWIAAAVIAVINIGKKST